ncbi:MAG: protein phosphatase [Cycloclasticus sp.]|jgi:serine/threonine protein phosphatase PrpC
MIQSDHFSHPGRKGDNQDSVLVCTSESSTLIAIADGMGGKDAGDWASKTAISTLKGEFEKKIDLDLSATFKLTKKAIGDYSKNNNIKQMGTTLTVCLVVDDKAFVGHVGDTRLYHLRDNGIVSITKDQTEVQVLLDDGILSKKRAAKYHRKNILLSAITNYSEYDLFQTNFHLKKGDRLVLLSDGAYDLISKLEIRDLSITSKTVSDLTTNILNLVKTKKVKDDYSLIAAQI